MTGKILFVDDEEGILSSLKRLFEEDNYEILTTTSGYRAIELFEKEPFDIIVSDQRMSEMDGVQFLEQAKRRCPESIRMMLTGHADINEAIDSINRGEIYRYITKPWNNDELKAIIHDAIELQRLRKENKDLLELTKKQNLELKDLNANLEEKVVAQTEDLRNTLDELKGLYDRLDKGYIDSVRVFSNLIKLRRRAIAQHHRNTAALAKKIALKMELPEEALKDIEIAALLHDIGKIGMSDSILNKSFADMGAIERVVYMKHSILGQVLLQSIEIMRKVGIIIRHHHERWDGEGYPDNINGEQIPIGSRIISIASDYDALMNGTLMSSKFAAYEAKQFIIDNKEKRYDPEIIQLSTAIFAEQEEELRKRGDFKIVSSELKEGMVVSRDIYTAGGLLLLGGDTKLTGRHIDNIINFEMADGQKYDIYILPLERTKSNLVGTDGGE